MLQNFRIGTALSCHKIRAVLAHTDSVAVAADDEYKRTLAVFAGEVAASQ